MSSQTLSKAAAKRILWNKGSLRWKLHELQRKIYDAYYNGSDDLLVMLISRQSGKSFLMAILAIEECLRGPNRIVKYVCQTQGMVKNIIKPTIAQIIEDCPEHLKPEWNEQDKRYRFKNGSEIQVAGSDNGHYDKIRGGRSHAWFVDEAGFCDELKTIVFSVLIPTTTTTKGKGMLASTPDPDKPEHEFITDFVEPARDEGRLFKYTIHDNPLIDETEKLKIINRYPGKEENVRFKAEYLCSVERNPESVVVPEFTAEIEEKIVTDQYTRPPWFDYYVSMDIGGRDFTVLLIAYFDFVKNCVVVEDEVVLSTKLQQNSTTIASELKRKKKELYGEKPVYLMYSDNNNEILLNDLQLLHKLTFIKTEKHNKSGSLNTLRVKIPAAEIIINPRCKVLIRHLRNAIWSKTKSAAGYKEFARGKDGSHYDAVDALIYLIRNIVYSKNPYPPGYNLPNAEHAYISHLAKPAPKSFLKTLPKKLISRKFNK